MSQSFNLTPRAKEDLRRVWFYTLNVWGEAQADLYIQQPYQRFSWLSQQPGIGQQRPDICAAYHCFPQGSHLAFYLIGKDCIDIIGVPHKDMDVLNYFDTEG